MLSAAGMVFLASIVQGAVGFGFGIIALPLLAIVMPQHVPQVLVILGLISSLWIVWRDRRDIAWQPASWLAAGRTLGALPGAAFVAIASPAALDVAFGAVGAIAVWSVRRPPSGPPPGRPAVVGAGAAAGAMGTATGVGGPPLLYAIGHLSGHAQRATAGVVFVIGNAVSLVSLGAVGRLTADDWMLATVLLPALVLGMGVSNRVAVAWSENRVRVAIVLLGAVASLFVLARGIYSAL